MKNFCTNCGTKLEENSKFCHNCGSSINIESIGSDVITDNNHQTLSENITLFLGNKKYGDIVKYGIVDSFGSWIVPPIYDNIEGDIFIENENVVIQNNHYFGVIDLRGNSILPCEFHSIEAVDNESSSNEYYIAEVEESNYELYDTSGEKLIYDFQEITSTYKSNVFIVEKEGLYGLLSIDHGVSWLVNPVYKNIVRIFTTSNDHFILMFESIEGKKGIMNYDGKTLINPHYNGFSNFSISEQMLECSLDDKWGVINFKSEWVIKPFYDFVEIINDTYFVVEVNEKFGIIDNNNEFIVEPKYEDISIVNNQDVLIVKTNSQFGLIDLNGNEILSAEYEIIESLKSNFLKIKRDGKFGIYSLNNMAFSIIPKFQIIVINNFLKDSYVVLQENKFGIIDENGVFIIKPDFDYLEVLNKRYLLAVTDGNYGYISISGSFILEPIFNFENFRKIYHYDKDVREYLFSTDEEMSDERKADREAFREYLEKKWKGEEHDQYENYLRFFLESRNNNKFFDFENIPQKKIHRFIKKNINEEASSFLEMNNVKVLFYFDSTVFGSGDNGFLILEWILDFRKVFTFTFKEIFADSYTILINVDSSDEDEDESETIFLKGLSLKKNKLIFQVEQDGQNAELQYDLLSEKKVAIELFEFINSVFKENNRSSDKLNDPANIREH